MTELSILTGVPFMLEKSNGMLNGCSIELYSAEELTKVFLVQCFDTGIDAACRNFRFNDNSPVIRRMKKLYVRFISAPCNKEAFTFFSMCYDEKSLIEVLEDVFDNKIRAWKSQYMDGKTVKRCSLDSVKEFLKYNSVIKKVSSSELETSVHAVGALSKMFLQVLCNSSTNDLRPVLKLIVRQASVSYTDSLLSIQSMKGNRSLYHQYFDAVLLHSLRKGGNYTTVLQEVCANYEI